MAKKKGKKSKRRAGPSPAARKAYNKNIIKAYKRLHAVVKQHNPSELIK